MSGSEEARSRRPAADEHSALAADLGVDVRLEVLVGQILRFGVAISAVAVFIGMVLIIGRHEQVPQLSAIGQVFDGLAAGHGWALADLGLFLLILTPVLRVAVSILGFGRMRDWPMTVVTAFVLAMLILSFALGKGGA